MGQIEQLKQGRAFDRLKDKPRKFVMEYLRDFNATQAAIRAGYSKKSARAIGCENLTKPDISDAVEELCTEIFAGNLAEIKLRVLRLLETIGFSDIKNVCSWGPEGFALKDSDQIDGRVIKSVHSREDAKTGTTADTNVVMEDKLKALDLLCKITGMYSERSQSQQPANIVVIAAAGSEAWNG